MTYHYTMCGLDFVYLMNGYQEHDTDYGKGISIKRAPELDRSIAAYIIFTPLRLRGQEVRFLRSLLRCSQTRLALYLGVKRLTVARLEGSPSTPIPGAADRVLRIKAASKLFGPDCLESVVELLPEITDGPRGRLNMDYVPHEEPDEPLLFPDEDTEQAGWLAKAA